MPTGDAGHAQHHVERLLGGGDEVAARSHRHRGGVERLQLAVASLDLGDGPSAGGRGAATAAREHQRERRARGGQHERADQRPPQPAALPADQTLGDERPCRVVPDPARRAHQPALASDDEVTGLRDRAPAGVGSARQGRTEQAIGGDQRDGGRAGLGGQPVETEADDDHADRTVRGLDGRARQQVRVAVEHAERHVGGRRRHGVGSGQAEIGRQLGERDTVVVDDQHAIGLTVEGERADADGAAGQGRRVVASHAVHDRGVMRENTRLAAHHRLGLVQRRPRGAGHGIDRGGIARIQPAREPQPATAPHHGQPDQDESEGEPAATTQRRSPTRCSFMRLVVPATHIGAPEMITMTSLMRTVPSPSSAASISSNMLVGGLHLADQARGHAPREREPPPHLDRRREGDDRHVGPLVGDEPRGEPRLREGDDGLGVERVGRRGGGIGEGLGEPDARVAPRRRRIGSWASTPARRARRCAPSPRTALGGIAAGGRLGRQHDGVGAVEDRGGDVGDLGPGGAKVRHHRLQHLGGDDHRHLGSRGPGG